MRNFSYYNSIKSCAASLNLIPNPDNPNDELSPNYFLLHILIMQIKKKF